MSRATTRLRGRLKIEREQWRRYQSRAEMIERNLPAALNRVLGMLQSEHLQLTVTLPDGSTLVLPGFFESADPESRRLAFKAVPVHFAQGKEAGDG